MGVELIFTKQETNGKQKSFGVLVSFLSIILIKHIMRIYYILVLLIIFASCISKKEKAKTMLDNGKYEESLFILSQIDNNDKDFVEAADLQSTIYFKLGSNFLNEKNYEKAIECFGKVESTNVNYNIAISKSYFCKGYQAKNINSFKTALDFFRKVIKEDDYYGNAQANINEINSKLGSEVASKIIDIARNFQKEYDILNFKFNIVKMKSLLSDIKAQSENIEDKTVKEYTISVTKGMSKVLKLYSDKDRIEYQGVGGGNAFIAEMRRADDLITNTQRKLSEYLRKNSVSNGNNTTSLMLFDFNKQIELIISNIKSKVNEKLAKLKNLRSNIQKEAESDLDLKNEDINKYFSILINYLDANINYYSYMADKIIINGRGEELIDSDQDLAKKENETKRLKKTLKDLEDKLLK